MGNAAAAAARQPPAGGVLLPIVWGTVKAETCPEAILANFSTPCEKPVFDHSRPHLPALQDAAWEHFARETRRAVAGMWRSGWEIAGLVVVLPILLLMRLLGIMPEGTERMILGAGVAVCVLLTLGLRFFVCSQNESRDAEVKAACAELANACQGRLRVEYRTLYTGFCKPRGTQAFRAVALAPVGGTAVVGTVA